MVSIAGVSSGISYTRITHYGVSIRYEGYGTAGDEKQN
jgi:hypothetical protein